MRFSNRVVGRFSDSEFPQANNNVIPSKTCERFGIFRLADRIQRDMQEPLIGWNDWRNS
jgi:hypothetical protein